jgi:peptide/nickel transport system substrate-binding protein
MPRRVTLPGAGRRAPLPPGDTLKSPRRRAGLAFALVAAAACSAPPTPPDSLKILLTADVRTLDPNEEVEQLTDAVLSNVYEPLVDLDEGLQPKPVLAESWEHPQPERWRFRLRKNVRFHDGSPLTAEIVRAAIESVRNAPGEAEASEFLNDVRDVVVVDAGTLDVVTAGPRALLANLSFLHVTKPNAAGAFPPLAGTGPYRLKERKNGAYVSMERWDDYWGPRAEFAFASFEPVASPEDRLARVENREADIAFAIPPDLAGVPRPGVRIARGVGLTVVYLGFGMAPRPDNPFTDRRVRRAFHLAIDRQEMLRRVLHGTGTVPSQPIAPRVFGFDPQLPHPASDLAASRRLLAEAGHGKGLRVRLDYPHERESAVRLLQEQLARVGVTVELNGMERGVLWERASRSSLFIAGWDCSTGESGEFFQFCLHTPRGGYGAANYGGFSHRRIDEIVEANAAVLDQRHRLALLQEAAGIAMEELPVLPLYVQDEIYALRDGLTFPARADNALRLSEVRSRVR